MGIDVAGYTQIGGRLVTKAGDGQGSNGILVDRDLVIGNELVIQRGGHELAAAVIVGNKVEFQDGSKLTLDLAGTGRLPVIYTDKAEIGNNVSLTLSDAATLAHGASVTHEFLITQYDIAGEFEFINSSTLDIRVGKSANNKNYFFTFNRTGTVGSVVGGNGGVPVNTRNLMAGLDAFYGNMIYVSDPRNASILADLSHIDTLGDIGAINDYANRMTRKYAPLDLTTALYRLATGVNDMTRSAMNRNLFSSIGDGSAAAIAAGSSDALAAIRCPSDIVKSIWLAPLAQWTRTRPLSDEFVKSNQSVHGAGIGFGIRQDGNFAIGADIHYLRSDLNSDIADVDSDLYGFNLFGRKHFVAGSPFNPFVEGGFGYSYADTRQTRKIIGARSKPDSDIYNVNAALGFDYVRGGLTLTPRIGIDYNRVRTGSFTETGMAPLTVRADNLDSVRGVMGLEMKHRATECLYVTASAAYRHEFGDRNALTSSHFTSAPDIRFVTVGEHRSRSSGDVGAGLGWQARRNALIGLNYDLGIAEKQYSHMVAARFALDF